MSFFRDDTIYSVNDTFVTVIRTTDVSGMAFFNNETIFTIIPGTDEPETLTGGDFAEGISGAGGNDILIGNGGGDQINGDAGDDTLDGGAGNDILDGGTGFDTALFDDRTAASLRLNPERWADGTLSRIIVNRLSPAGDTVFGVDQLVGIEAIRTADGLFLLDNALSGTFSVGIPSQGLNFLLLPTRYDGPLNLNAQMVGSAADEVVLGTAGHDFINGLGGMDAIDGGTGNDVIDGGTGSNFLVGGAGIDTFFCDGRGGTTTWSTITDWQAGEQLSLWGYQSGVSTLSWEESAGAEGYTGATLHADLNGDGTIDTSITWAGRSRADLPAPQEFAAQNLLWFTTS